ncbi:MAG: alpha/beta hydrolase [Proteobacteria bacterium]|nr:alpha/beta hydrolase [Pseudomonadota bacterium]MDA1059741.1 alpha/beta hydrolase [Pseudomonadota bacterium]
MTIEKVNRGFVEVDEGQIHYRACGSEDLPPLVMLHGSPLSALSIEPLIREFGHFFRVIAPDTLGNGDSSPQGKLPVTIPYLADGMLRGMAALGLKEYYVYGFHTGGNIGIEAALAQPKTIKKLIIDGMGLYSDKDRADLVANQAPEINPDMEGTQLLRAWHLVRDGKIFWPWWNRQASGVRGLGLPGPGELHDDVVELLKCSRTYHHNYRAALGYDKRPRAALLKLPVLVTAAETDMLRSYLEEAASLIPGAKHVVGGDPKTVEGLRKTAEVCAEFLLS